jgi:hypothetical protein
MERIKQSTVNVTRFLAFVPRMATIWLALLIFFYICASGENKDGLFELRLFWTIGPNLCGSLSTHNGRYLDLLSPDKWLAIFGPLVARQVIGECPRALIGFTDLQTQALLKETREVAQGVQQEMIKNQLELEKLLSRAVSEAEKKRNCKAPASK